MRFEIIILTWNRLPLLKQALESALYQSMPPDRIIVMDNASDDGTSEYLRSVASMHKHVIVERSPVHMPVNGNIRAAIDAAREDWFIIMHDDDVLSPDFVAGVRAAARAVPSATMISPVHRKFAAESPETERCDEIAVEVYGTGVDYAIADFVRFISDQDGSMCFPAIVYRRECVSRRGLDMDRFGKICDKPFVYDSMGSGAVVRILTPLYNYRLHGGQDSSTSANGPFPDEILNFLERQRELFSSDAAQKGIFDALSVLWMKSLYFWGRNPKSEWRNFFRMAKKRGLVRGFLSKPWKHWLWRALTNRKVSGFQKSRMPAVEHIALKGEEP